MKLHFAGADGSERYNELLREQGAENRLESFWTLKKNVMSTGFNTILDSGGFVARNKGVKILVQELSRYIRKYKVKLAFELDTMDLEETKYNREYLIANTQAKIIPIYHCTTFWKDNFSLLRYLMDNFDYIGISVPPGTNAERREVFYNYVFKNTRDKIRVHGLGITNLRHIKMYPFFSVDSTSWLSAARYGNFKSIEDENEALWAKQKKHFLHNTREEIKHWVMVERFVTKLWEARGVAWKNLQL